MKCGNLAVISNNVVEKSVASQRSLALLRLLMINSPAGDYSAHQQYDYGSINSLIFKSQNQAKVRIIVFLLVFTITGLASECGTHGIYYVQYYING